MQSSTATVTLNSSPTFVQSSTPTSTETTLTSTVAQRYSSTETGKPTESVTATSSSSPSSLIDSQQSVLQITVLVTKQTSSQILDPNTYLYARKKALCQSNRTHGWITQIKPYTSTIPSYNITKSHPVNTAILPQQCAPMRNLRTRELEELYDVDIVIEVTNNEQSQTAPSSTPFMEANQTLVFVVAGVVAVLLASVFILARRYNLRTTTRVKNLTTRVQKVNPLNQIPVIVPWVSNEEPWRLSDTLPPLRNDYLPMQSRRHDL